MSGKSLLAAAWGLLFAVLAAGGLYAFFGEEGEGSRALVSLTPSEEIFAREAPSGESSGQEDPAQEIPPARDGGLELQDDFVASAPAVPVSEEPIAEEPLADEPGRDQTAGQDAQPSPIDDHNTAETTAASPQHVDPNSITVRVERRGTGLGPAWLRNSTPFSLAERHPLVAVVVTRLGLGAQQAQDAILRLPPQVSLSFTPYARGLDTWIPLARQAGHEVLMDLPMEGMPEQGEVGHFAMSTQLSDQENIGRLMAILERSDQIMGLARAMGDVFVQDTDALYPVLATIQQAGLAYLDSEGGSETVANGLAQTLSLPHAKAASAVNRGLTTRLAVDAALALAEAKALETGGAVVTIEPSPVAYERLLFWAEGLQARGVALAPLSELILRGEARYLAENQ